MSQDNQNNGASPFAGFNSGSNNSIFGNAANKPATSMTFGNSNPSTTGTTGGSLFGSSANAPALSSPGFSFNNSGDKDKPSSVFNLGSNASAPSLFGSKPNDAKPTFGFGNKDGQEPKPSSIFGAKPDEPKQGFGFGSKPEEPKQGSLFGGQSDASKTAPSSLFGSNTAQPTSFSFATNTDAKKDAPLLSSKPQENSSLFGSKPNEQGSVFGSKPEEKGSLFGSKPAETNTLFGSKPAEPNTLFGSKPAEKKETSLFGSKPEEKKNTSLFGSKPAEPNTLFGSKPAEPNTLFGSKPAEKKETSLFGSKPEEKKNTSLFGSKPAEPNTLFGSKPAEKKETSLFGSKPEEKKSTPLFGAKPEEKKDGSEAKPAENNDTKTFLSDSSKPVLANTTDPKETAEIAAKKTSQLSVPTPEETASYLQNRSLEDIISKWTTALTKRKTEFTNQATDIAAWDRVLSTNGDLISQMYTSVTLAERKQSVIDQNLDYISRQQDDIDALLETYEAQANELLSDLAGPDGLQPVDHEREKAYRLAEDLDEKLGGMSSSLSTVINEINDVSSNLEDTKTDNDPLTQIVKVLNSHLSSLQWIDSHTSELQDRLDQIDRLKLQANESVDVSNKLYGQRFGG